MPGTACFEVDTTRTAVQDDAAVDFRHTFATDMIHAGFSLPALMYLMGHAQIQTTMVCVSITPQDVYHQYVREDRA